MKRLILTLLASASISFAAEQCNNGTSNMQARQRMHAACL